MIAAREGIGFHNQAARADIYRYLILFIDGGVYIDIDIDFKFEEYSSKFDASSLITTNGIKLKMSGFPLKCVDGQYTTGIASINNDIIASIPGHFILQDVLGRMLEKYHHLDQQLFLWNNHRFSLNDVKRSGRNDFAQGHEPKFPIRGLQIKAKQWPVSSELSRLNLTKIASGPDALLESLFHYIIKENLTPANSDITFCSWQDGYGQVTTRVFGVDLINHNALSWLKASCKKRYFDTNFDR